MTPTQVNTMHPQMTPMDHNEPLDILGDLPRSTILKYEKGQAIYDAQTPASHLYLVIEGRVKVLRTGVDGRQILLDVYHAEELFGESALLNLPRRTELAIALEPVKLMAWTPSEIHSIIQCKPQLGVALSQMLTQRLVDCQTRVESFAVDRVNQRLARTLIRLAGRSESRDDGSARISGLKHQLLSDYVVTTRATVTHWMNCFRRQGFLRYSRDCLLLYPEALKRWLDSNAGEAQPHIDPKIERDQKRIGAALTSREREVVGLVGQGLKNREIAQQLSISEQTVKNHLQNIFDKLGASNRHQATRRFAHLSEDHAENHRLAVVFSQPGSKSELRAKSVTAG
jgi:CRP-like cAMP-binding protein/DNA-binding CsgD family transcriptional regulator